MLLLIKAYKLLSNVQQYRLCNSVCVSHIYTQQKQLCHWQILIDRLFKPLIFAEVLFKQIIPFKVVLQKLKLYWMTFSRKTKSSCDINHIDMLPNCAFWENSQSIINGDFWGAIKGRGSIRCENVRHGAI